jgi:hypothetical protein
MCQQKAIDDAWCCCLGRCLVVALFLLTVGRVLDGKTCSLSWLAFFAASLDLEGVEAYSFLFEDRISNDDLSARIPTS